MTTLDDSASGHYIPRGCAHGFEVLSAVTRVIYSQDVGYVPTRDSGIALNSFSFDWITEKPIIFDRNKNLPKFSEFSSTPSVSNP